MKYKLPSGATSRAIVDDVELELDGEAQDLTDDQVQRLADAGVELESDDSGSGSFTDATSRELTDG